MKYLLIAVLLFSTAVKSEETKTKICMDYHDIATTVMKMRQNNVSMSKMIKALEGNKIGTNLVILAYDKPRYSVEKNRQNAVKDFANNQMKQCLLQ